MPKPTVQEQLDLVRALFARSTLHGDGKRAIAAKYPAAPEAMVNTAAHHLYVDGVVAALQFLAEAELFLRDPAVGLDGATTYHLLDHLYNWHQFSMLIPYGKPGVLELLAEIKKFVADDDREALLASVRELNDVLEGDLQAPDLD